MKGIGNFKTHLETTAERISRSQLGVKFPHLRAIFLADLTWVCHEDQLINADAELTRDGSKINLYPSLASCPTYQHELMREFGLLVLNRGGQAAADAWSARETQAEPGAVASFQNKLASAAFKTYREVVDDFKTAVDRFVALNLANALIANHVPIEDSVKLNVTEWGATREYAIGKRKHPLDALLGAYCPARMLACFGETFADAVLNELRSVRESSTAAELRKLVEGVVELAR
jgi:hypothetical protein